MKGGRPPHQRELVRICGLAAVRAVFERDPGGGQVQSLNVAAAAAILIYLLTRP